MALLLGTSLGGASGTPAAHATDINDNPECQQMFDQMARPLVQQLLWYTNVAPQYPVTPQGRPVVTGWPYSAYGPGNGYGPGSPYGPALGPWGMGAVGPGTAPPLLYGAGALGPGGPGWQFARAQYLSSLNGVAGAPPGLSFLGVASGIANQPPGLFPVGGLGGPGTADLLSLAGLAQGEVGNALAAQATQLSVIGNVQGGAGLMQSVIGNRLAAADLNATLTDFPLNQADHLGSAIGGIQTYVNGVCPRSIPEDSSSGSNSGSSNNGSSGSNSSSNSGR
jgi:hypothetical protein